MDGRLIRLPVVVERIGRRRSTIYADVACGVLPPPVRIGSRAVAWIEAEVGEVIAARVRGASEAEVRTLVKLLIERRAEAV